MKRLKSLNGTPVHLNKFKATEEKKKQKNKVTTIYKHSTEKNIALMQMRSILRILTDISSVFESTVVY